MQRRTFLTTLGGAAAAGALLPSASPARLPQARAKQILVLGGTNFVGPAVVVEALARGHEVTLFNRGITRPDLFPEVERLRGVRAIDGGDLRALEGSRRWDAVVDIWPEEASLVQETATLLDERTDYYAYVSSIAVYADYSRPGLVETDRVRTDGPAGSYGAEKARAEHIVRRTFEGRHGVVRCPGIVGPLDPGASYHYWLRRLATQAAVLCPGSGDDPVQVVDVRDVAAWVVGSVERGIAGTHNLTGPWPARPLRELLMESASAIGSRARLVWVDADFLRRDQGVRSFSEMPLWAPVDEDEGFYQIDGRAALEAGATFRPVAETAAASWRWFRSHFFKDVHFPYQGTGVSDERERAILEAWRG